MPRTRDRHGRFTAERRTTTTTTTTAVTERVTVEEPPPPPIALPTDPAPVFARLLRHPPEDATWAHPHFIADEAARAVATVNAPAQPFTAPFDDTAPVQVVTVPRTYPALEPDTLAHEFTETDREQLALTLGAPEYLP